MTGQTVRRRVVVHGHVQGVFFRDTARREAARHGVSGWVRNTPAGTVEAVFEGEREAVEQLVAFAREGPTNAQVERVESFEEEPEGLRGFETALAAPTALCATRAGPRTSRAGPARARRSPWHWASPISR